MIAARPPEKPKNLCGLEDRCALFASMKGAIVKAPFFFD